MGDEQAIANLLYRYAELIDAGDFEGVGALLAGARVHFDADGPATEDAAAVVARFTSTTRRYDDGTPRTAHVVTNPIIEVAGDAAAARSRYTVLQAVDGVLQPIIAGRYHDRFARGPAGWRFTERRYLVDLVGDLSAHLPPELVAWLRERP